MNRQTYHLRELAHARSGDKGDTSNVAVIAYRPEFFDVILRQVTEAHVRDHFGELVKGAVTRYVMPQFSALNLVLQASLGGGVTRSLSLDPHGKSYSALILTMPIVVDESIAALLQSAGRSPIDPDLIARLRALGRWPSYAAEAGG